MANKTHYLENKLLDHVWKNTSYTPPTNIYVGLFTAAPSDNYTSGVPDGTECSGGSYARTAVTFNSASGGATANSGTVTFPTSTAAWNSGSSITHFGLFDASSGGNLLAWNALTTSRSVNASGITLSFAAGALTISED